VDAAHEAATLTVEVGVNLLLKGGLVEVATADSDTESNSLLLGLASHVLVDGDRRVDTTSLTEERADGAAGTLGGNKDDINVLGDLDLGEVLEDGGETVGEVESLECVLAKKDHQIDRYRVGTATYLALGELGLDGGPGLALGGITEEVHDDGTPGDGLVNVEQVLASNPAILLGILPRLAVLPHANNHIKAVVTEVKTLTVTLRAVANKGEGVVLEVVLQNKVKY
jgi:hypothetical protein